MWFDEIICQEDNAVVVPDIFLLLLYIDRVLEEGIDNSVAQQIWIQRQIVLHQSICCCGGGPLLWKNPAVN
jgi:hypothetical protein